MTVSNTTAKAGPFPGNGVATAFAFSFKCYDKTHVQVLRRTSGIDDTLVLDSDYSVSLNADQNTSPGGSITYPLSGAPLTALQTLTALSAAPDTQATQLTNTGGFFPQTVENMVDLRTIVSHQNSEALGRALKFPATDSAPNPELPNAAARANQVLGFDANGDPSVVVTIGAIALPLSLAQGGLGAAHANVAGVRTTLGIPAVSVGQTDTGFDTGGVAGTLTLTPTPALGAYAAKVRYNVKFGVASTGADTINVSGLGAKSLKQYDSSGSKVAAIFGANMLSDIEYDGVDFVVLDAPPAAAAAQVDVSRFLFAAGVM